MHSGQGSEPVPGRLPRVQLADVGGLSPVAEALAEHDLLKAARDDLAAKTEAAKSSGAALQAAMVAKESEILKSLTDDHQALQQIVTRPENL